MKITNDLLFKLVQEVDQGLEGLLSNIARQSIRQNSTSPIDNRVLWHKIIAKSIRK